MNMPRALALPAAGIRDSTVAAGGASRIEKIERSSR